MAIQFSFKEEDFNNIFPFYMLISQDMVVKSAGKTLGKIHPGIQGKKVQDNFLFKRPFIKEQTFESIQSLTGQLIVIECFNKQRSNLRGQVDFLKDTNELIFLGTPWFNSIEEVIGAGLTLHDFANHDPMTDLLHLMKTQEITNDDLKQLLKTVHKQRDDLKVANKTIHDIALFPTQNPDPLIRINYAGDIIMNNPAAAKFDFLTYENKLYRNDEFFKFISAKIDTSISRWEFEASSEEREFSFVCVPMKDEGYINIYGRDITQQLKDRLEVEKLSLIIQQTVNAVIITDVSGNIEWVNNAFNKITGYTLEEIKGKTPGSFLQGKETNPATVAYMRDKIRNAQPFTCEIYNYTKQGKGYWLRVNGQPVFDKNGNITQFFAIEEDITAEKTALEKMEEFDKRLKVALAKIGDNVWEHDFKKEETSFSQEGGNFLGYDGKDFENNVNLWYNCVLEEDKKMLLDNDTKYRAGEIDYHILEYRMAHKDGSIKWVLDRGVVIEKTDDGKPLKIIGTHTDITRQKATEIELKQSKKITEELAKTKQNFLANMSHEIRTPMNAIMGMAGQLEKTTLDKEQHFFLDTIRSASENLLVIINDILDLSKIEAGKLTLEKIGFQPQEVVGRAMQVMKHKAEEKGLAFTNSFLDSKQSPVLLGDPYRLNQVLLNLISNAIKFTEKGNVDVSYIVQEDTDTLQKFEFIVRDTGIGMEEEFARNLFQKFSQEDETITRKYGGTGLGMSICKELVDLMGGRIYVESKKGKGTSVIFEITFEKGTVADLPQKKYYKADTFSISGKKILIADDNKMNRLVAGAMLKNYKPEIFYAVNGIDAIEKIKEHAPDLVLMDIQMPEMDGIEATRIIRNTISEALPVIALTALAIKGDEQKCKEAGLNDYLSKPFEEIQLINTVCKWLGVEKMPEVIQLSNKESSLHPLFSLSKIEDLAQGEESFIDEMIDTFVEQVALSLQQIHTAFKNGDAVTIKKVAHRIKPSIDNLSIESLRSEIREIEAEAGTLLANNNLKPKLDYINTVLTEVTSELLIIKQTRAK